MKKVQDSTVLLSGAFGKAASPGIYMTAVATMHAEHGYWRERSCASTTQTLPLCTTLSFLRVCFCPAAAAVLTWSTFQASVCWIAATAFAYFPISSPLFGSLQVGLQRK